MNSRLAIVTGASSGLGAEFVRQIDEQGLADEIWLVARRADRLAALASKLAHGRGVPLALDLTRPEDVQILAERIADHRGELSLFVNNAGFGLAGRFTELAIERQVELLELNVTTLTRLAQMALRHLRPGGALINVASVVGFFSFPGMSVYAASKAYVVSLSVALAAEVRSRGIQVVACCPGAMRTEFFDVAGGRVDEMPFPVEPRAVVTLALKDARRGRVLSVASLPMKLTVFLTRILPRSFLARQLMKR